MTLIAGHQATGVLEPGEEALDLPATAVAAELATVRRLVPSRRAVWGDELDAALGHAGVQRVAIVPAIADDPRGQPSQEASLPCGLDERDFGGVCTCDRNGERKTSTVCACHDLGALPFAGEADAGAPFFAPAKVASMNASVKSYPPAEVSSRATWANT